MNDPTLVVLAAGIGRRYGGLKQMDPVGPSGEFIIDYSVFDAIRAGFGRVVFVVSADIHDAFVETIGARVSKRIPVDYALQQLDNVPAGFTVPSHRDKPWGTGHAVLSAAAAVNDAFAMINADDFYGAHSFDVLARFLRDTADDEARYAMVGFVLRNTVSDHGSVARGVCTVDDDGMLEGVVERTRIEKTEQGIRYHLADKDAWHELTGEELVSMNMWGFKRSVFGHLDEAFQTFLAKSGQDARAEFFVPTVVDELISAGKVTTTVLQTPSRWFGVTYPQDKEVVVREVCRRIEAGEYPADLWGVGPA